MPLVASSAIWSVELDGQVLVVTFTTGRRYAYVGVPQDVYDAFLAAESKGAFFNEHIRDSYSVVELTARSARAPR